MVSNVFSPKKKYNAQGQLMSQQPIIQGSGYGSNYASNASNYQTPKQPVVKASNYNTQNYMSSMFKQPTTTTKSAPKAQGPMSVAKPATVQTPNILPWGTNTGVLPWGIKQPTTTTPKVQGPMSTPRPVGPMSVAPKANMSVDLNAGKYQAPAPKVEPQPDINSEWMNYIENAGARRQTAEEQRIQDEIDFIRAKYGLSNQQLAEALPEAQATFDRYKTNTEATIADLLAGGERQKSQTRDYYGEAQRGAAQTLRETQGQTQRTFANLGTLDSRGEGSFAQANENTMSDFNRFTQQNLKAQADKLSEIDAAVAQAERSARETIAVEEQKMNQLARDIQYAIANNNLSEAKELTDAYNQSQSYIYDIQDGLAQTKYAFALEQQKLENEIAKTQSFTPEFMATGVPTNQAEYEFLIKNKKDMDSLYGTGKTSGVTQNAISAIDQLLQMDTNPITGLLRGGGTWVGSLTGTGQAQQGLYDQIRSLLTLDNIQYLKGTGQISDKEQEILTNASSRIRPGMGDAEFRQALEELRAQLSGQQSLSSILG